ncbi:membrane protein of ER body 2-like isoform X1 [Vitis riparia]|uniref:membrane protein of ER body 2-like isoform X1 n=1 Tax=Vitis riparia TaxID=96939 RepID=UPI00155A697A|nr:membrane protein of ER body 2-like isoform X1 [Vitis riparia]
MAQVMKPVGEEIKAADGSGGSGSSDAAGIGHITIDLIKKTDGDTDFKLGRFLEEPDSHKFRCPHCNACIENINVVRRGEPGPIITTPGDPRGPITTYPGDPRGPITTNPGDPLGPIPTNPGDPRGPITTYPGDPQGPITTNPGDPLGPIPTNPGDPRGPITTYPGDPLGPIPTNPGDPREPIICASCSSFLVFIGDKLTAMCNPQRHPEPEPGVPAKKWDILKSIVYGGLLESIASLTVVTSAAGADATALKILALGLANVIGGLFVIGHNLMELRNESNDQSGGPSTANEETGRYHRELGLKENFIRHATVAVLSFLLFGLVAPVTYSFSFLKSGNKDLKLVAVAAASLVCITVLAIGKAYTQKASGFFGYIKTVSSFVIPGFMASGVSYVVGDLIEKLLEKLGLFESSSAFALSLPGTATPESGWGFY